MNNDREHLKHKIEQEEKLYNNSQKTINLILKEIEKTYQTIEDKIKNIINTIQTLEIESKHNIYKTITQKELHNLKTQLKEFSNFKFIPQHILKYLTKKLKQTKTKIDYLDLQIDILIMKLAETKTKVTEKLLLDTYSETANDDYLELLVGAILVNEKSIRQPRGLDSKTFETKIWENSIKTSNKIKRDVRTLISKGASEKETIDIIDKYKKTENRNTKMSIEYENRAIAEQGAYEYATKTGATHFKIIAVIDEKTTEICRFRHNRVYPIELYEIGSTVPPLHYNCRSIAYYLYDYEEDV
ncbi:minor capsid protein [Streptobacillus moniliformis]|uniref:minor capsid protein n=1 Tax=Streptobacillus moniliformis TaxID=34105 RepID=UPI0007E3B482|nr:minor capsid protein [Streptobacillus moniliformis]